MTKLKGIIFIGLIFIVACNSSSKITSSWKAQDAVPNKYKHILVLGLIREADRSIQENMENHFVGDLKTLGYYAVSSLHLYGPKAFDKMDEQAAIDKLKTIGVDAVITIVLLNKEKETRYVPGNSAQQLYPDYYSHFWEYRTTLFNRIYDPGYYILSTNYFWESNLYDMKTQNLVYSVQTKSFDPSNTETMAHEYGKMIVKNMLKEKVLVKEYKGYTVSGKQ